MAIATYEELRAAFTDSVCSVAFDASRFSKAGARKWLDRHGLKATRMRKRGGVITAIIRSGDEGRTVALDQGVRATMMLPTNRAPEPALSGKARGAFAGNGGGASPGPREIALPDLRFIYYQPDDPEREKQEQAAQETRRRSGTRRNEGAYGIHGTPGEPVVAYNPENTPLVVRGSVSSRSGRKPTVPAKRVADGANQENRGTFPRLLVREKPTR